MKLWEQLQVDVLNGLGVGGTFTSADVAATYKGDNELAKRMIRSYTDAQRRPYSGVRYTLVRKHRTATSVWTVGRRTQDGRDVVGQLGSDINRRIVRAIRPDLANIGRTNPRAVTEITSALVPAVDSLLSMVVAMLAVAGRDIDDE